MIRHWAAAFEDWNPVYTNPEVAASSRFGGIVAPPLMLQTWTMSVPAITGIAERGGSPVEVEGGGPLAVLDESGLVGTLATNSDFEILRYLSLGERISASTVIETVSDLKETRLGAGRFVTWATSYVDGAGEAVGRQRFRILKFRPGVTGRAGAGPAPPPTASREKAHAGQAVPTTGGAQRTLDWSSIAVGEALSEMKIDVTATVIVAGAIATRDFMPVHHDRDYARSQGAPDIFMNILSDTAYCSRFLTDWCGPDGSVRRLSIRLGVPVFPGQVLRYRGKVIQLSHRDGEVIVTVELAATTDLGDHVTGTAEVGLLTPG